MKLRLTICLLVICLRSFCQTSEWFELGSTWTYSHFYAFDWNQEEYLAEFEVTEILEFNGRICSKIESTVGDLGCLSVQPPYYVYESNDSVFYASEAMDTFLLAYVFGGSESWNFTVQNEFYTETYLVSVLNSEDQNIDGLDLQRLTLDYENMGEGFNEIFPTEMEILEYIGAPFYFVIPFGNLGACDGAYDIQLRCFSSPTFSYQNPAFESCTLSNIDLVYSNKRIVYPNPASNYLYWEEQIDEIEVFNTQGKRVLRMTELGDASSLSIEELKEGLYTVRMRRSENFFSQKLMINR